MIAKLFNMVINQNKLLLPIVVFKCFFVISLPLVNIYFSTSLINILLEKGDSKQLITCSLVYGSTLFFIRLCITIFSKINNILSFKTNLELYTLFNSKIESMEIIQRYEEKNINRINLIKEEIKKIGGIVSYSEKIIDLIVTFIQLLIIVFISFFLLYNKNFNIFHKYGIITSSMFLVVIFIFTNKKFHTINDNVENKFFPLQVKHQLILNYIQGSYVKDYNGQKEIRGNFLQKEVKSILSSEIDKSIFLMNKKNQKNVKNYIGMKLISTILLLLFYWLSIYFLSLNNINIAFTIRFVSFFSYLFNSINVFQIKLNRVIFEKQFARKYIELMNEKIVNRDIYQEKIVSIELKNVYFKYPNKKNYAVKNISLRLKKGDSICIVGKNGAGKSTLLSLFAGLLPPTKGKIIINSKENFNNLDETSAVFQNFTLFSGTIKENIMNTCPLNDENLKKCLQITSLDTFLKERDININSLIYNYESSGIEISSGEEQKIAIARALYKESSILLLDEIFSSNDFFSENTILKKILSEEHNNIKIFISHHTYNYSLFEKILYMENGEIVDFGSHDELMVRCSSYKNFVLLKE